MMSELSDDASSESDPLGSSLSVWLADGGNALIGPEELNVPLDLHTASSIGQYDVVAQCIRRGDVDLDGKDSVNVTTSKGLTPLMLAASCGNESIAYFLLQQGAQECKDVRGWTALLHSTATGHQQMVKFLLDNNANTNVKEPISGFTPLMEAAASGHEIIVQYLLNHASVNLFCACKNLTTLYEELSSSEEESSTPRVRSARNRTRGPSIHDGPQAIARFRVGSNHEVPVTPPGYVTFREVSDQNELFFDNDMPTMRSSSSSSEGLSNLLGLSREASLESNELVCGPFVCCHSVSLYTSRTQIKPRGVVSAEQTNSSILRAGVHTAAAVLWPNAAQLTVKNHQQLLDTIPHTLDLRIPEQIGFSKYLPLLKEQDIDLRIFLTLTENDLKEVGITAAYADQLEAEMQEMAIQLHKRCVEVESLQAQVSQEKELRAVMEGCLMEEKMAWKNVQAELQENAKHVQTLNGKLHALCNAHIQLTQVIREDELSVAKGDGVMCAQMLSKMDSYMGELADSLKEIFQNLQSLSSPEKNSHNWEES
ncbi:Ankyrin repeat and SAM domain-containing protein 3 [Triplophysa tibetana]|uniref:Ankyrin repeat and SAM domain-containing protein 3 n=1 Tax=Triplophysa tibetana TaxID=1572043 RepID=A0A5A9N9Q2_9TELE|nr:Ankyrin repeat and SAM domain-containing protein 3 [Triplophysa tibetana]